MPQPIHIDISNVTLSADGASSVVTSEVPMTFTAEMDWYDRDTVYFQMFSPETYTTRGNPPIAMSRDDALRLIRSIHQLLIGPGSRR